MTLAIPGSPLTFTLSASSINTIVAADGIDYSIETRKFQRKEYSNTFLMNLVNSDGSSPIFINNASNLPIQINFNCGVSSTRSPLPDDSVVGSILQKMVVKSYILKGSPTAPSKLDPLYNVALDHKRRFEVYESYLDRLGLKLSYQYLVGLQSETFSYLTSTGLTVSGEGMSETNCLIRSFNNGVLYTNPTNSSVTCRDWGMQIDIISFIESCLVL